MLPVESPFKTYTGLDGKPLDNGFVYFGLPDQDPVTHPVEVYWDAAGTLPAAQPLRTVNGYIVRNGTPANVFFDGAYSELVRDSKDRQVFYARTSEDFSIANYVSTFVKKIGGSGGADDVGFILDPDPAAGAVATNVASIFREKVSAFRFLTPQQIQNVSSGVATIDVTDALQKAIDYCMKQYDTTETKHDGNSVTYMGRQKTLLLPAGIYKITRTLNLSFRNHIELLGENEWNTILRWAGPVNGMILDARCSRR